MRLEFLLFGLSCLFSVCVCVDMIVGDTVHRKMVFHQRVKDFAIPFKKRIKSLSYTDSDNRKIKGIAVIDNDFSHASANVTAGGVGFSFVTGPSQRQPRYAHLQTDEPSYDAGFPIGFEGLSDGSHSLKSQAKLLANPNSSSTLDAAGIGAR